MMDDLIGRDDIAATAQLIRPLLSRRYFQAGIGLVQMSMSVCS